MSLLTVSGSPHVHSNLSVEKVMWNVVIAMVPAMIASFLFFGWDAVKITAVAIIACLVFEYLINRFLLKQDSTIGDGSAVITGMLLAFNVPSSLPVWQMVIGSLVAIGIGKMTFGGLGKNPFNPALVGRVFMLISFPVQMTHWPKYNYLVEGMGGVADTFTGATPLGVLKEGLANGGTVQSLMEAGEIPSTLSLMVGQMGGSLGEVSAILLALGGIYMLARKIITWHIPVSFLATVVVFAGILWLIDPTQYVNPLFHLITGGIMLGVFFMATDMVTSPMNAKGQLIFGFGVGLITMVIRIWGAYPEGVSFAILFMNAFVPHLNRLTPKRFGDKVAA
jgi:electron transport complex protein RnfD